MRATDWQYSHGVLRELVVSSLDPVGERWKGTVGQVTRTLYDSGLFGLGRYNLTNWVGIVSMVLMDTELRWLSL